MIVSELEKIKSREVFPGLHGRFLHSDNMTFAYWEIDKDAIVPAHAHVHEQVVNMLEGKFELTINGKKAVLEPGMVTAIPSNAVHEGRALTPCRILDVFYPIREDYRFH